MTEEEIKKYTQRMPASLYEMAKNMAQARKMSLNNFIIHLVENEWNGLEKSSDIHESLTDFIESVAKEIKTKEGYGKIEIVVRESRKKEKKK